MKKAILTILAVLFCFSFASCKPEEQEKKGYDYDAISDTMEADTYEIGFVTDIGQLKDKSFNQGTWEGLKRYAYENGKSYKYYQPGSGENVTDDDRYNAMKAAVSQGAKIVVCAGFMQEGALRRAATEFKEVKFVFIDGYQLSDAEGNLLTNIAAIAFNEEQSGYLAGYAAVMEGYTKLGFTGGGGGSNPACQRFGYGYIQGANDAAEVKKVKVEMKYSWLYGSAFSASSELESMLDGWYDNGKVQVIFACGGSMCNSAFSAADKNGGKVIGVDVDQSSQSPTVITSATKGLREGAMSALASFYDGKFDEIGGKLTSLGAKEDAVSLPTDTWSLKNFTVEQYEELFAKIKNGTVKVDNNPEGAETKSYANVTIDYIK